MILIAIRLIRINVQFYAYPLRVIQHVSILYASL